MRLGRLFLPVLALALVASPPSAAQDDLELELVEVAGSLTWPTAIAHAGDGSGRLFIAQQTGEILIVSGGSVLPKLFLDLSTLVSCCSERGLLGLAFHPDYASNGFFYVNYTDTAGDTVVARYRVSASDPNVADPNSATTVLTQGQPNTNHNGGQLAFGPDGYLYIALGDGGGGGDPGENAQDLSTWLGKILRLDIDDGDFPTDPDRNYSIPPDNPFVGQPGLDEIWAWGLRNPWRFSFDRLTGDLWIGDVGQNAWEEVDRQVASSAGGENYGWDVLEGGLQPGVPGPNHPNCYTDDPKRDDDCADYLTGESVLPVAEYAHVGSPCDSITGGYRYRGTHEPRLGGIYFNADYCRGQVRIMLPDCSGGFEGRQLLDQSHFISSFGEDESGELYLTEYSGTSGQSAIHRITADPASGGPELMPDQGVIDFGTSSVGSSAGESLTLSNTGTGVDNLVIEFMILSDDVNFSLDLNADGDSCGSAPVCLPPGGGCTLEVTFAPQREGGFDELLLLPANSVPGHVTLQGTVPCNTSPDHLPLTGTIEDPQVHTACQTITAGPNLTVTGSGDLELRAGESIGVQAPFTVESGGALRLVVDPVLAAN